MKILLINPGYREVYKKVPSVAGKNPPINLACLAAYLREHKIDVSILDAEAEEISLGEIQKHIPSGLDVVGVGAVTPTIHCAAKILEIAKQVNPKCKTIIGGCHITALPEETMKQFPVIDYGVLGEGEITALELLNAIENNKPVDKIKGIVYKKNNSIKVNSPRQLIENLDELPFPAYDLLPMHLYSPPAHHTGLGKNIPLKPFTIYFTGRGCPHQCTFCAAKLMWQRRTRYKSIKKVMSEIDILVNKFGIKNLEIDDETFTLSKKRVMEFNSELRKRNYDLKYICITRVDTVDRELLEDMKSSGCYFVRFGVESGSQKILNLMKKGITVQKIKDAFKAANDVGITTSASFIIGYPGETWETFNETINLAKEIKPTLAYFFVIIPIVGTELYHEAKKNNLLIHEDWNKWVQMPDTPMIKNEALAPEDVIKMRDLAYKKFYFRPSYILRRIAGIRSFEQLAFYAKGVLGIFSLIRKK